MVCQAAANDRLSLPCQLWLFLCPTEDTLLLSVSLWMVWPAFGSPPAPTAHSLPTTHPPPTNSIHDITAVGNKLSQNPAVSVGGRISYKTIAT